MLGGNQNLFPLPARREGFGIFYVGDQVVPAVLDSSLPRSRVPLGGACPVPLGYFCWGRAQGNRCLRLAPLDHSMSRRRSGHVLGGRLIA